MIVLDLPENVAATVETLSARAGMKPSAWLTDQVVHAYGSGRVSLTDPDKPRRPGRSARRRYAAASRAARAARRAAATTITENTTINDH